MRIYDDDGLRNMPEAGSPFFPKFFESTGGPKLFRPRGVNKKKHGL
jgi:hypothetical protein